MIPHTAWRRGVKHQIGVKNNNAKLDEMAVRTIRDRSDLSTKELGVLFGVAVSTVERVRNRQLWAHVE
jgi:DNA-binding transcriptional regulator YiaG